MPLKDTQIRNAKPREKPYKLSDGAGLYIEVKPTGSKLWRYRYRISGKENMYAIGAYPEVSLDAARTARKGARNLVKDGIHPSHDRKLHKIKKRHENANTFEAIGREWLENNKPNWTFKSYQQRERLLERDVFPQIGSLPIRQVVPAHLLDIVQRVEKRAPTMAIIVNQALGAICRLAIVTLRAETDPSHAIRGSLKTWKVQHRKPLSVKELPEFMKAMNVYTGYFTTRVALKLMLLTLVRTSEALGARWEEFDIENAIWSIPAERMKMGEILRVPLQTQAIKLLEGLHAVTGSSMFLFPNRSNYHKSVSKGVLWKAVSSMGYTGKFSPHGIRATGSTTLNEMGYRPDIIEHQLAHREKNKTRASYNRADYLEERREMMQWWANYLDELKNGTNVIAGKFKKQR
jgi:integrase